MSSQFRLLLSRHLELHPPQITFDTILVQRIYQLCGKFTEISNREFNYLHLP